VRAGPNRADRRECSETSLLDHERLASPESECVLNSKRAFTCLCARRAKGDGTKSLNPLSRGPLAARPADRHRGVAGRFEVNHVRSFALIRLSLRLLVMMILAVGGFPFPSEVAFAQAANELPGTWTLVSITVKQDDHKFEPFGPNPKGLLIFDRSGRFSIIVTRSDLPKLQSNDRSAGTPEEDRAIVQGSIAYFGTYSANEADHAYILHVEGGTFPNWIGTDQKRIFTITGDELKYTNSNRSGGAGTSLVVWKRAR
jgi:hypothetical protein